MATLYLHIGMPKTGTTSIQKFMAENREVLAQKGYCYPDWGFTYQDVAVNRNGHFLVHMNDGKVAENPDQVKVLKEREQIVIDSLDELASKYDNIVLSEEDIWLYANKEGDFWESWKAEFAKHGIEMKIIVYLRRQDLFVQSFWAQKVKTYERRTFSKYVEAKGYSKVPLDYYKNLRKIEAVIGKENMIVRVYEKCQYEGANLVTDFMKMIGLEMTDEYCNGESVFNTSLAGGCIEVKRIWNSMPEYKDRHNFSINLLKAVQEDIDAEQGYRKVSFFSADEQVAFLQQFEESNALIAKEYLGREDGKLFLEPLGDAVNVAYSKDDLVKICGRVVLKQQQKYRESKNTIRDLKSEVKDLKRQLREEKAKNNPVSSFLYSKGKSISKKMKKESR